MSKKRKKRRTVNQKVHEDIIQSYLLTGNMAQTARKLQLSYATVVNHLKNKETDPEFAKKRREAALELAGKVHNKADQLIDAITPEDLESGYVESTDRNGVVRKTAWGPSLLQKATSFAILTDKLKVIEEYKKSLEDDRRDGFLPLPSDIGALVSGIRGKVERLNILNVQFKNDNPDLSQKIQESLAKAEIFAGMEPVEAEFIDFDNPGADNIETRTGS